MLRPTCTVRSGQTAVIILAVVAGVSITAVAFLLFMRPQATVPVAVSTTPMVAAAPMLSPEPVSEEKLPEPTKAEIDQAMGTWIDETAGHPDDPQLPTDVLGASDEVLAAADPADIADMLRETREWVKTPAAQPRHLFALGRAALAHGYDRMGNELLENAAKAGSPAAVAYQGYAMIEDGKPDLAKQALEQAQTMGFKSRTVTVILAEINAPAQSAEPVAAPEAAPAAAPVATAVESKPPVVTEPFKASDFARPELIGALHEGNFRLLNENKLNTLVYISNINDAVISQAVFLGVDRRIMREVDRTLGTRAGQIAMRSPEMTQAASNATTGTLGEMFKAMANARREGASINDEVTAVNAAASRSPVANLQILKQQAEQDGTILATLYDSDVEAFRKIYGNMKKYIADQAQSQTQTPTRQPAQTQTRQPGRGR